MPLSQRLEDLPAVLTPEEAFAFLRVGRSKGYELLRTGQLFSVRVGRSFKIPRRAVERFLAEPDEAKTAMPAPLRLAG